ncbi:putative beta-glucosidase btgE [Cytospora mali]|uniref:Probable beta-glucosidase btgE n=1 Tax=Cytospora mali TaxID=578113 RepID=A0A194UQX1_CYTMA|nr:putative beta-glucosidase btgE [Valsa mali var. pyri (nom. inval.)]
MKATLVAAALLGGASAHAHRRGHEIFHKRANDTEVCVPGCTTTYTTVTGGDFIWKPTPNAPPKVQPSSSAVTKASSVAVTKVASSAVPSSTAPSSVVSTPAVVPTPVAQTIPTPGTYTFPATTMTVTNTTSAVAALTTTVPAGTHTLGGVTTVVETATTIVCPYATVSTQSGGVVTSVIETTTYVCPAAGTYTIAPTTTTVTAATETVTVPVVTTYYPGTYTAPAVTTVVSTETVVYCPFASSEVAAVSTSTAAPTTISVLTTSSILEEATSTIVEAATTPAADLIPTSSIAAALTSVVSAASASLAPVASSASAAVSSIFASSAVASSVASSTSASASATSTSTGVLGSTGKQWAMTYTPYDSTTGDCKTADVVDADVASIAASGFSVLRVYSTDCDTLPNVGSAAAKYGVKMITGIFISEVGCTNASPDVDSQISALKEWAQWDLVDLISVGNEALYDGYCTPQELVDLIAHVKSELSDYTGPYTTTDIVSAWQEESVQSVVCDAVDVVAANVHSYFSADVAPVDAGAFVKSQIEIVEQACGGKTGYVLECGYPTSGATNGLNIPSVANQKIAITSIQETIGEKVVFFSMFNDQWKSPGTCECEQFWGVGTLFGALGEGDNE